MDYQAYRLPDGGTRFEATQDGTLIRAEEYGVDVDPEKAAVEFKRLCEAQVQRAALPIAIDVQALRGGR